MKRVKAKKVKLLTKSKFYIFVVSFFIVGAILSVISLLFFTTPSFAAVPNWDTSGKWVFDYHYNGSTYLHDMTLSQDANGILTGSGGAFSGDNPYQFPWVIDNGVVDGNNITFTANYSLSSCSFTAIGLINSNGSMNGEWTDNCDGVRNGTWSTTSGNAIKILDQTANKEDCYKDGWKKFTSPVFKNQGQCVSHFVSTKDKKNR